MTLDDLESQNRGFNGLFGDFGLRHNSIAFEGVATRFSANIGGIRALDMVLGVIRYRV